MSVVKILEGLSRRLDETSHRLTQLDQYYAGEQPLAFLSREAKEALGNRLTALTVNYPRVVVDSIAERLRVIGFSVNGEADDQIWQAWERSGMEDGQAVAHVEALTLGRSYVLVWTDDSGAPSVTVESPHEFAVVRDPVTRKVTAGAKRWVEDGRARALVFLPDKIHEYVSGADVPTGGVIPAEGWNHAKSTPNPLGTVPVVQLTNRGRLLDHDGVSEMTPVLGLTDAIGKLMADLMVASEFGSRPRRWITGLEVKEEDLLDADGNPVVDADGEPVKVAVNPFTGEAGRVWQVEEPEARLGQFPSADLGGFTSGVDLMLQGVATVSGLPAHYLGVINEQPPSADAIRSAEASLVARCHARMRTFTPEWAKVAQLIAAVQGERPARVEIIWDNPETRTEAQTADAVTKLVQANILPTEAGLARLGYTPEQVESFRAMRLRESLDRQIVAPPTALPTDE
ncbi:phage portal protein [Sporichthya polymorpha]|uniref:phage portal protein n=1 Tax=Sporichthya polymorpha TaxID=35751 RepID=UPI0003635090|nr:phage portal protein [Sporichthya polymorpha]